MPEYHRRSKGHIPRGKTGGLPYKVICKVCQDPIPTNMAVEEQIVQTETCIYRVATTTSVEEQDVHTEVCETEVTELSPKKRRQKRDKVASSIKE